MTTRVLVAVIVALVSTASALTVVNTCAHETHVAPLRILDIAIDCSPVTVLPPGGTAVFPEFDYILDSLLIHTPTTSISVGGGYYYVNRLEGVKSSTAASNDVGGRCGRALEDYDDFGVYAVDTSTSVDLCAPPPPVSTLTVSTSRCSA